MNIKEKISIIIPCYNEENTVSFVINKAIKSIKLISDDFEIIVVDDFSTDETRNILKNFENNEKIKIILKEKNYGKGAAIQTAFKYLNGKLVIIQDADLEYDPSEYNKLLLPFFETDADIVYGSRFLGGGKYVRLHFFWHYVANNLLTFLCNLFTNINMTDMETGFKVFKSSCIKDLNLKEKAFGFEPEFTIKLAKKKYKFYEVAISYNGRSYQEGKKIGLKDAFRAFYCIFKYSILK
jgi:glycosyltransferase involved in cell wall biosynthesis